MEHEHPKGFNKLSHNECLSKFNFLLEKVKSVQKLAE